MKVFRRLPLLIASFAALLAAGDARAQVCNLGTSYFFDKSVSCPGAGRELCNTGRMYLFNGWSYGGKRFLVGSTYSNAIFYDVSDPLNIRQALDPGAYQPWGQGEVDSAPDTDSQQWDVALLDDYQYGLAMFQSYGWSTFRVNIGANGWPTGFTNVDRYRQTYLPAASALYARLFRGGDGSVYAAASRLDRSGNSVRVAQFTNGVVGSATVPVVGVSASDPLEAASIGGKWWLFALHRGAGTSVLIYDLSGVTASALTNPLFSVQSVASVPGGADFYLDKDTRRLFVLVGGNPFNNTPGTAYVFSVANPASPSLISTVTLGAKSYSRIAGSGDLVVVAQPASTPAPWVQAYSIANLNAPFEVAPGQLDPPVKNDENIQDLWVGQGVSSPDMAIAGAAFSAAFTTRLSATCLSLDPHAAFTVTGGDPTASCGSTATTPSTGVADEGFPGDTFTINDGSYGQITGKTLTITAPGGGQVFSSTWNPLTSSWSVPLTWTPAAGATIGEYQVRMTLTPATSELTRSIGLCGNPKASLVISQENGVACTSCPTQLLINDTLNVSAAASADHPTGYNFYVLQGGSYSPLTGSGSTLAGPYPLTEKKSYTIGVVAHYGFAGSDDAACSAVPAAYKTAGVYNSCASVTVSADYGVSAFEVWQNNQKVADAATPGIVLIDQVTTLKFIGKVASDHVPNFVWTMQNVAAHLNCQFTAPPYTGSTCPVAANTWTAGSPFAMNMGLQVCTGTAGVDCTGSPPLDTLAAPPVTVTPSQYSVSFDVNPKNPSIGQDVTITLTNVVGTLTGLTFNVGGSTCAGGSTVGYVCGGIFGNCQTGTVLAPKFQYGASAGGRTVTVTGTASLSGGGTLQASNSVQVTVGTTGSCGPQPLTVSPNPSSATVGTPITFTISPTLSHSGDTVTFNYGDGQRGTVNYPCPLGACAGSHAYSTAGPYTVTATATIGGASYQGSNSVTITSGGGGGNLALSAKPNPANQGDSVTISFLPKITQPGDTILFNFGDGQSQNVVYDNFCQLFGGCGTISHTYTSSKTFNITGSGTVGGSAVNGSTTVTVQNNCTVTSAPTAAFAWQPTQVRVGQVVQFQDASTGGPTAWSWSFGGPGVSGSSTVQAAAVPLAVLTINPSDVTPNVGKQVVFTFSPTLSRSGDTITFNYGDGQQGTVSYPCPFGACAGTHTYSAAGTFQVTAAGAAGGVSVSGSTSVVVSAGGGGGTLTITPSPASATIGQQVTFTFSPTLSTSGDTITFAFGDGNQGSVSYPCPLGACSVTHAYSAAGTFQVTAAGTAGGVSVSGTTSVVVSAAGGPNPQNPTFTYTAAGTYTVTLTATNCRGSSMTTRQIVVLSACAQTGPPVADFTWGPTGPLTGFPEQMQPYAGQQVTLTDHSTNEPSTWHWYDFQEDLVDSTVTTPTFTHAWKQPGDKNVRMTASNCSDQWSAEVLKTVHIYEDVRHVVAAFSWSPSDVTTGLQVTFNAAQGPSNGDPDDFTWTFDDGSTQSGASVTYSFKCGGNRRVTLAAKRKNYNDPEGSATVSKSVPVSGQACGPESVMGVDAAKIQGLNDTNWHADLRVYNPSSFPTSITLQFLPVGKNNVDPFTVGPYQPPLPPKGTLVLDDILQWVLDTWKQDFSKTALRVTYRNDDSVAPVVTIRTYNLRPDGSKYGQINPGVNVVPGTTLSPQWITGLRNNGMTDGFRTNYSIVNLQGDEAGVGDIKFTIFDETGVPQGTKTFGLAPFGYIQDSIKNLFGSAFENIGTFSLKIEVPAGKDVQVYASVMDNHTGDPVLIPATTPPDSPIYLPAIAHNSGEAGTVWRTDLQLTNPDADSAHTWEIKYTPTGKDPIVVARPITLAPDKSVFMDDLVSWVYGGMLPADAETKGIVRIAPTDGSSVYPIVAARSFNLTPVGTFGQGIPPLSAARGISTTSENRRLVLTAMSSEDIARTNLGFVNVSEAQGVNFVVYFYDANGNVLNPPGTDGQPKPYTFAIGPGSWDQDKLENRFRNAFKVALPANLSAISAEITVNDGGPGFAYASVIDNKTGDPNFIPAQPVP